MSDFEDDCKLVEINDFSLIDDMKQYGLPEGCSFKTKLGTFKECMDNS